MRSPAVIGVLVILICLSFIACKEKTEQADLPGMGVDSLQVAAAFTVIAKEQESVQTGDLLVRTGRDFTSYIFKNLSENDKTYSHCGIASIENDSVFVYHVLGGESNPDEKLRRDPLSVFCNPFENEGFGIYRYELSHKQKEQLMDQILTFYHAGLRFDLDFDLENDEKMYCSEMVYKALKKVSHLPFTVPLSAYNHKKFIPVASLYANDIAKEIVRISYK